MKVVIDLIEDIRIAILNDTSFTVMGMKLEETEGGDYTPIWQSNITKMRVDKDAQKLFFFLGKEDPLSIASILEHLNALGNEEMMYEVCISYSQDNARIDSALEGFGEIKEEKKYLLFMI